jgi:hypothetical protein
MAWEGKSTPPPSHQWEDRSWDDEESRAVDKVAVNIALPICEMIAEDRTKLFFMNPGVEIRYHPAPEGPEPIPAL